MKVWAGSGRRAWKFVKELCYIRETSQRHMLQTTESIETIWAESRACFRSLGTMDNLIQMILCYGSLFWALQNIQPILLLKSRQPKRYLIIVN